MNLSVRRPDGELTIAHLLVDDDYGNIVSLNTEGPPVTDEVMEIIEGAVATILAARREESEMERQRREEDL